MLPVQDEKTFAEVHGALEKAFAPAHVDRLSSQRAAGKAAGAAVRGGLWQSGLLGEETSAKYAALSDSDRGQIRERYLSMVERVDPAIRAKFLKVYAYY